MRRLLFATILLKCAAGAAAGTSVTPDKDTETVSFAQCPDSVKKKKGLIKKFLDYIAESNKARPDKKFDFSLLGGPHYSTDTKFGVGIVATGIYRTDRADSLLKPSNVDMYGDITTGHFYKVGVCGIHIFPHDRCRIDYNVSFDSFKSDFWGIGYSNGDNDLNKSTMKRLQVKAMASMLWRFADNLYVGPSAVFDYACVKEVERPELLDGMDRHTLNVGAGVTLVYDSRDVITNPHRGFYVNLSLLSRPAFMGNDYAFTTADLRADMYRTVWKGGVLAADVRGTFNFGNPSWSMMSLLGNSSSMRGYYEGRYRDKHKIEAQLELRQHVWRRNGVVVWAGAGTVFGKFSSMRMDRLLPNYGIGYRWEFKKNVNVRLDYGFGKNGQSGFIFNIGEAF